ncbi:MAG: tyrosine-type recombinase/integrase [Bacteroidetes bacterium]|nr:tyrosine-type recombinase/integrase [Bacteroidota bacterium]
MLQEKFINYIKFEKRYSQHTVIAYQTDLAQFQIYLQAKYNIGGIENSDYSIIRSWMVSLMEAAVTPRTIRRKITVLNSFFKFIIKEGVISENPMAKVIVPKASKRLPVFVEQNKMDLLLDEIDFGTGFNSYRDRIIIELLYYTGMRLSELVNLKEKDIDIYNNSIKVLGKRNKERIIPFGGVLKASLNNYIIEKEKVVSGEIGNFFLISENGKKIYQKLVYRLVKHYISMVSTMDKKSPHVLRHSFATHLLNNGAELNAIKEILGHSNLSATQIYTHNSIEKLKTIYKQAHPKA